MVFFSFALSLSLLLFISISQVFSEAKSYRAGAIHLANITTTGLDTRSFLKSRFLRYAYSTTKQGLGGSPAFLARVSACMRALYFSLAFSLSFYFLFLHSEFTNLEIIVIGKHVAFLSALRKYISIAFFFFFLLIPFNLKVRLHLI